MRRDFVWVLRAAAVVVMGGLAGLNLRCGDDESGQTFSPLALPLTISVSKPTDNVVVSDDITAEIRWADIGPNELHGDGLFNDPPVGSTVTIKLDPDVPDRDEEYEQDGNEIDLFGPVDAVDDAHDRIDFDGLDAVGEVVPVGTYYVLAVLDNGAGTELTDLSLGTIRVPFAFTEPREDAELAEADDSITIEWEMDDGGLGGLLSLALDTDLDHTSGNEELLAAEGPFGGSLTSFEVTGSMITAAEIEPGIYYLCAWIEQSGLDDIFVTAPVQITIGNFGPPTLEFVGLDEDVEALVGDVVTIEWDDEDVDDNATINLFVDSDQNHNNGNEIQLIWDRLEDPDGLDDDRFVWDTTSQRPDEYYVFATISDGTDSVDVEADGRIMLRKCEDCPLITLIAPATTVTNDTQDSVVISWDDDVPSAQAMIALYYVDPDEENPTLISEDIAANPDQADDDQYEWEFAPDDLTARAVPQGVYKVKAYIKEGVESPVPGGDFDGWDMAMGMVIIKNTPPQFEFVSPEEDAVLVIGNDGADDLTIDWQVRDAEDEITFDLFIDPDADHENGNERRLNLDPLTAPAGAQTDSFDWINNGVDVLDATGLAVPPGEYTLVAVVTAGPHDPLTVEADGKVIVQAAAGSQPRIMLDEPLALVTVRVGDRVRISWADDYTNTGTKIRLRYDDDPTPDQDPGSETGEAEENITDLIDAQPDADDDEFMWLLHPDPDPQVDPANILEPAVPQGVYWVFAYIGGADPVGDPSCVAVAAGKVAMLNTSPELIFTTPGAADIAVTVGAGQALQFNYRDPEDDMQVKLYLDPDQYHSNGNEVRIDNGDISLAPSLSGGTHDENWDGTDIAGQDVATGTYFLFAEADDQINSAVTIDADAKVNVVPDHTDPTAVIVLASPVNNTTKDVGEHVDISWADFTPVGSETITLVYSASDTPDDANEVGAGETEIVSALLALPDGMSDSYSWDTAGVEPDTYFIHAKIVDDGGTVLDVSTARGTVEIKGAEIVPQFEFLQPANVSNLNFHDASTLDIVWQYESSNNGTVSIFLDRDTTNANGNEILILDNRAQAAAPGGTTDLLDDWDMTDKDGADVPTGIYYIRGVLNVSGQTAKYDTAGGQVKVRSQAGSPLVQFTLPTSKNSFKTNESRQIQITWDVDDPNGDAEVYLWYGTTVNADDEADFTNPVDGDGITGVAGVPASNGAFTWFISAGDLGADTYYIHAVIGGGGDYTNDDDRDTAKGKLIVSTP